MSRPLLSRITSDPGIFGGKPLIRGQRFAVQHLLDYLAAGMTEAELLAEFPFLEADDIRAALLYASRLTAITRLSGPALTAASKRDDTLETAGR